MSRDTCKNGHAMTPENTLTGRGGCRQCARASGKRHRMNMARPKMPRSAKRKKGPVTPDLLTLRCAECYARYQRTSKDKKVPHRCYEEQTSA